MKKTIRFGIILAIICVISLLVLILTNNSVKISDTKMSIFEKIEESQIVLSKIQVASANEYYTTNAKIRLNYGQDNGNSGIDGLYYRINKPSGTQTGTAPNDGYEIIIYDEGTTVVEAWMKDNAGNQSVTVSKTINKDSQGPTVMATLSASDITIRSFKLNIKIKDEISGVDKIEWYYKKSTQSAYTKVTTLCSGETGTITKSKNITGLTSGQYKAYAILYDKAGNTRTTGKINITTQNIEEVPTLIATPAYPVWTNDKVVVTPSDTTVSYMSSNGLSLQYQLNGINGTWSNYTNPINITNNNTTVYYRYTDGINNGITSSITISNIDKENPKKTTVSGIYGSDWKNNVSVTLSATDTGGSGVSYFEIDSTGDGNYNGTTSSTFIPWNGYNAENVRFRAVDNAGNKGAWSNKIEIHMDTEAPSKTTVDLNGYISGQKTRDDVVQTFTATDNVGISYYQYSHDGVNPVQETGGNPWTINWDGHWDFYVRAIDYAGNCGPWSDKYNIWRDTTVEFTNQEFIYTGDIQTFTVPITGIYRLEVWGAQGQNASTNAIGGKGGYSVGNVYLEEGTKLYIGIGGQPTVYSQGGYNGGGKGDSAYGGGSGAGGGATHIAKTNNRGTLNNYSSNRSEVLIVAGGGGGASYSWQDGNQQNRNGGAGGGLSGENGSSGGNGSGNGGAGGSSTSNDLFGQGSDGYYESKHLTNPEQTKYGHAGGGGGGYYAGKGGTARGGTGTNGGYTASGGGGSGYVDGLVEANSTAGVQEGNGKAKITFVGTHTHTDACYHHHTNACYRFGKYVSNNINGVCEVCGKTYTNHKWACRNCGWTGDSWTSYCTCGRYPGVSEPTHNHDILICGYTEGQLICGY